jgi:hypothetical protein
MGLGGPEGSRVRPPKSLENGTERAPNPEIERAGVATAVTGSTCGLLPTPDRPIVDPELLAGRQIPWYIPLMESHLECATDGPRRQASHGPRWSRI